MQSDLWCCRHLVSLCLDLDLVLVHPHYPSSSWKRIASCNNNLVWALKVIWFGHLNFIILVLSLYSRLYSRTKIVELEEWYKAFTQQKSKLDTYISSLLNLSNLLILTNFSPGEANFQAVEVWKFSFSQGATWAPLKGVAPWPHQGLCGPWTPAFSENFL